MDTWTQYHGKDYFNMLTHIDLLIEEIGDIS